MLNEVQSGLLSQTLLQSPSWISVPDKIVPFSVSHSPLDAVYPSSAVGIKVVVESTVSPELSWLASVSSAVVGTVVWS